MIDVDNFKKYNDTHGHPAGDILLKQLATILQKHCAITETPCRYGGEEFVIIIPQREQQDAQLFVEELRKKVQEQLPTTISIGIITCANSSLSYGSMLSNADQALYKAKNTGKNRVVSYLVLDKNLGIIDIQEASAYGKTE
jgi:diguanylate cyclase (GGDEF)-like protein